MKFQVKLLMHYYINLQYKIKANDLTFLLLEVLLLIKMTY